MRGARPIARSLPQTITGTLPVLLALLIALLPAGAADGGSGDPFARAALVPEDVTLFLHVERPARLRHRLEERPIADAFDEPSATATIRDAWTRLAGIAGRQPGDLFDALFGRELTLVLRRGPGAGEPAVPRHEWAVITRLDAAAQQALAADLRLERTVSRTAVTGRLPEHDILFAAVGATCVIGPASDRALLDEIVDRAGGEAKLPRLIDHEGIAAGRTLAGDDAALLVRHPLPMGGWSVLRCRLDGDRLELAQHGRYDNPPFERPRTKLAWDPAPLERFEGHGLAAVIEPIDLGPGLGGQYLEQMLGTRLLGPGLARKAGDRRIIAIGEVEGRGEIDRPDLLLPAFAVAIQVRDRTSAREELDRHLRRLTRAINDLGQGSYLVQYPAAAELAASPLRHVDLRPAAEHLGVGGPGFPIMRAISLDWMLVESAEEAWWVVASHPRQLEETARALTSSAPGNGRCRGAARREAVGMLDGIRLARHLETYRDQAGLLAADDPTAQAEFAALTGWLARLARGVRGGQWELRRPTEREACLTVWLDLAPHPSAGR